MVKIKVKSPLLRTGWVCREVFLWPMLPVRNIPPISINENQTETTMIFSDTLFASCVVDILFPGFLVLTFRVRTLLRFSVLYNLTSFPFSTMLTNSTGYIGSTFSNDNLSHRNSIPSLSSGYDPTLGCAPLKREDGESKLLSPDLWGSKWGKGDV